MSALEVQGISTKISADLAPLRQGFSAAGGEALGFKTRFDTALSGLGTRPAAVAARAVMAPFHAGFNAITAMAHATSSAVGGILGRMGSMFASPVAKIAAAAAPLLLLHKAIGAVSGAFSSIDATVKGADALGMTTEAFVALRHQADLAGIDMDSLQQPLTMLQKNLVDAANGSGTAGVALTAMGLSAARLADLPTEQALGQIGDALSKIPNAAERSATAADLFGMRAGPRLMNLLTQGSAGIAAAREEAERLGITFNRVDAAKVEQANDAMTRVHAVMTGLFQKLAIEFAPAVQGVAEAFTKSASEGEGWGKKIVGSAEWAAVGIAAIADVVNLVTAGWKVFTGAAGLAFATTLKGLGHVLQGMDWLLEKLGQGKTGWGEVSLAAGKSLEDTAKQAFKAAGEDWDKFKRGDNSAAVAGFFDELKAKSQAGAEQLAADAEKMRGSFSGMGTAAVEQQKKIREALDEINKARRDAGLDEGAKKLSDFMALPGVTPEQIEEFRTALRGIEETTSAMKLKTKIKEWAEELKTPAQRYREVEQAANDAFEAGKIGQEELAVWMEKAKKDLDSAAPAVKARESDLPTFMRAGSQEAIKFINEFKFRQGAGNDVPSKHFQEAQKQTGKLESIDRAMQKMVDELNFRVVDIGSF